MLDQQLAFKYLSAAKKPLNKYNLDEGPSDRQFGYMFEVKGI